MTLIQIISGETLQNVFPILALRPEKVVSVFSQSNPVFLAKLRQIQEATVAGSKALNIAKSIDFHPENYSTENNAPLIEDFRRVVSRAISEHGNCVINYTGGTKNMSIGAWLAAKEKNKPTIYCDSPRSFTSGGTGELEIPMPLQDVAKRLDVSTILAAQGLIKDKHWKVYKTSGARIAFGRVSFELLKEDPNRIKQLQRIFMQHGNPTNKKRPDATDIERCKNVPLKVPEDALTTKFLDAALRTGLLIHRKDGWYLGLDKYGKTSFLRHQLDKILMQLTGGAYEGFIHAQMEKSSRFTSFLHGVMPVGKSEDSSFGETDFLAFEPSRTRLALISCKSSAPSLEHLEATLARKAHFGGVFANAILCIKSIAEKKRTDEIRSQCKTLGIECLIGSEVESAF